MDSLSSKQVSIGLGSLPKVNLASPDGARAEIYLHGAQVTSWVPVGGKECLFLSRASEFHSGAAIRGGIPVIFPQFGALGNLIKHGFVRTLTWELISISGEAHLAHAKLALHDNEFTRSIWPYPFRIELGISVGGKHLAVSLAVINTGDSPLDFTGALHTYLRVNNIQKSYIEGLHRVRFHDTVNRPDPTDWTEGLQTEPALHFPGEVDRVYYNVQQPLWVRESGKDIRIASEGFPNVVIWNPGPEKSARLTDMEPGGYLHMVCVEAAIAGAPAKLEPGENWHGVQTLSAQG